MVIFDFTYGEIISINTIAILILKLDNLMQTKKNGLEKNT